jgi:very-short-patch-repair endonuclease
VSSTDAWFFACRVFGQDLPEAQTELRFHPVRKWRFDVAYPGQVAVEIDGGQWKAAGGRHSRDSDREKLNEAAVLGWRVLRFSTQQLEANPEQCIDTVRRALTTNNEGNKR